MEGLKCKDKELDGYTNQISTCLSRGTNSHVMTSVWYSASFCLAQRQMILPDLVQKTNLRPILEACITRATTEEGKGKETSLLNRGLDRLQGGSTLAKDSLNVSRLFSCIRRHRKHRKQRRIPKQARQMLSTFSFKLFTQTRHAFGRQLDIQTAVFVDVRTFFFFEFLLQVSCLCATF